MTGFLSDARARYKLRCFSQPNDKSPSPRIIMFVIFVINVPSNGSVLHRGTSGCSEMKPCIIARCLGS